MLVGVVGLSLPVKTRVSATDPVGLVALTCIWKNPAGCACWLAEACGAAVMGDSSIWYAYTHAATLVACIVPSHAGW